MPPPCPRFARAIVAGYMAFKTWVNSLTLLPMPPAAGSAAQLADEEAYKAAVAAMAVDLNESSMAAVLSRSDAPAAGR